MSKKKPTLKERIRRGGPTLPVPVWIGVPCDVIDEYEKAYEELNGEHKSNEDSLAAESGPPLELVERVARLKEQLEDYVVEFTLRGLDDKAYGKLVRQHPPRKDDEGNVDKEDRLGFNYDTFPAALIRATTVAPALDDEDWVALLGDESTVGSLTKAQISIISGHAYRLCVHPIDVPFWSAVSTTNQA